MAEEYSVWDEETDVKSPMEDMQEQEVIRKAQEQDSAAIDFLMHKYKGIVRRRARPLFIMGGDRDDLVQEGMIGLFKAIRDYDAGQEAAFETFAELCISRQMYSAIKSSNRNKNIPLNNYISLYMPAYSSENDEDGGFMVDQTLCMEQNSPEEILIHRESMESAKEELLRRLSKMEKQVLILYLRGLTYREIARKMGKSSKSIDNALQRIKSKVGDIA